MELTNEKASPKNNKRNLKKQKKNSSVNEIEKIQKNGKQKKNFKRSLDEIENPPKKFAKVAENDAVEQKGKLTHSSPNNNKKNFNKQNNKNQSKKFAKKNSVPSKEKKFKHNKSDTANFFQDRCLSLSLSYASKKDMASHLAELMKSSGKYDIKYISQHLVHPKKLSIYVGEEPLNEVEKKNLLEVTKASRVYALSRFAKDLCKLVTIEYDNPKVASTILKKGPIQFRGRKVTPKMFYGRPEIVYESTSKPVKVSKDTNIKKQSAHTSVVQDKEMVEEESDDEEEDDDEEEEDDE